MTRKAFIADVATASNATIAGIEGVQIGDEGEDFIFAFTTGSGDAVLIRALATGKWNCGVTPFLLISIYKLPMSLWRGSDASNDGSCSLPILHKVMDCSY